MTPVAKQSSVCNSGAKIFFNPWRGDIHPCPPSGYAPGCIRHGLTFLLSPAPPIRTFRHTAPPMFFDIDVDIEITCFERVGNLVQWKIVLCTIQVHAGWKDCNCRPMSTCLHVCFVLLLIICYAQGCRQQNRTRVYNKNSELKQLTLKIHMCRPSVTFSRVSLTVEKINTFIICGNVYFFHCFCFFFSRLLWVGYQDQCSRLSVTRLVYISMSIVTSKAAYPIHKGTICMHSVCLQCTVLILRSE